MKTYRPPSNQEEKLIKVLIEKAKISLTQSNETLLVCEMGDGKMGSLYLLPNGIDQENRLFGYMASELEFTDKDGVKVIASLNIDTNGNLFELDIWKTDFNPLIRIPDSIDKS